jgi:hypothetical protein
MLNTILTSAHHTTSKYRISSAICKPIKQQIISRFCNVVLGQRKQGVGMSNMVHTYTTQCIHPYFHLGYDLLTGFGKCNSQSVTAGQFNQRGAETWCSVSRSMQTPDQASSSAFTTHVGLRSFEKCRPLLYLVGPNVSQTQVLQRYLPRTSTALFTSTRQ